MMNQDSFQSTLKQWTNKNSQEKDFKNQTKNFYLKQTMLNKKELQRIKELIKYIKKVLGKGKIAKPKKSRRNYRGKYRKSFL